MRGKIKFLLSGCNCERNKATIEWVENLKETARSREERRTHEFFRRGWSWLKLMLINRYRFQNGDNYISYNIKCRNYMFSHRLFKSMLIGRRFGRRWSNFDWIKWEFLFRFDWKAIKILSCSVALFKHNFLLLFVHDLVSIHSHYFAIISRFQTATCEERTMKVAVEMNAMFI